MRGDVTRAGFGSGLEKTQRNDDQQNCTDVYSVPPGTFGYRRATFPMLLAYRRAPQRPTKVTAVFESLIHPRFLSYVVLEGIRRGHNTFVVMSASFSPPEGDEGSLLLPAHHSNFLTSAT